VKDRLSLAGSLLFLAAIFALFASRGELWRFLEETFKISVFGWGIVGGILVHIGMSLRERLAPRWPRLSRVASAVTMIGVVFCIICAYAWVMWSIGCTLHVAQSACPDYRL
jgi:hypothetical protein